MNKTATAHRKTTTIRMFYLFDLKSKFLSSVMLCPCCSKVIFETTKEGADYPVALNCEKCEKRYYRDDSCCVGKPFLQGILVEYFQANTTLITTMPI